MIVRPQTGESNTMATNPREVQGRKGGSRVALCIMGAGIGMAFGAAIGEDGAFIAVGLILARMRRPSSGGRAESGRRED